MLAALLCVAGGVREARAEGTTPAAPTAPTASTATAEAERLCPLLRSEDPEEREQAARGLLALGDAAVPALESELARAEAPLTRIRALLTMLRSGPPGPKSGGAARAGHGAGAQPSGLPPPERWWEEKFRDAVRRIERGDHLGAVKLLDAILTLEPDCPIRERIQQLRIHAKELQLRLTMLEAKLVPKKVLLAPGDAIELQLELKNVSSEDLDLASPDSEGGGGDLFGTLEIETYEANAGGERSRLREPQRISMTIPAKLTPAETWRTPLTVRPLRPLAPGVFRRLTISGSIRSQTLARKDERVDRFLPLFPVEVFVVEPARHALAAEPVKALGEALQELRQAKDARARAVQADRLFFAAMLAPAEEKDRAIALLGGALEREDDAAAPAAMATLALLSDRPLETDRVVWLAWVKRRAR